MMKNLSELRQSHLLFRQMLETEYDELKKYILPVLETLRGSEADRERKYSDIETQLHSADQEVKDFASFRFLRFTPDLLRHSLFTAAYSFFEYALKKFCELTVLQFPEYKRRVADFEKLHQYYSFLRDDLGLKRTEMEEPWRTMNLYRDIRNSILHHNSTIGKNISTATYDFLKEDPRIEFLEPRGFRIREDELLTDLIAVSQNLLYALAEAYEESHLRDH